MEYSVGQKRIRVELHNSLKATKRAISYLVTEIAVMFCCDTRVQRSNTLWHQTFVRQCILNLSPAWLGEIVDKILVLLLACQLLL